MQESAYTFQDALTGALITNTGELFNAQVNPGDGAPALCESLFFPGCSLMNYGLPLVDRVASVLMDAGIVQGTSLICCGKILAYEPNGDHLRTTFEDSLVESFCAAGVKRIITACPNCAKAFRAMFARNKISEDIEILALPSVMAQQGFVVDADIATTMVEDQVEFAQDWYDVAEQPAEQTGQTPLFSFHDSCPDRQIGEFSRGLRALLPQGLAANPEHFGANSQCCGSLVRAAGHYDLALQQSKDRGTEALDLGARAIVTACMSCSFLLSVSQRSVPVFHYLELLFNYRIDWKKALEVPKTRYLFASSAGGEAPGKGRPFVGLRKEANEQGHTNEK